MAGWHAALKGTLRNAMSAEGCVPCPALPGPARPGRDLVAGAAPCSTESDLPPSPALGRCSSRWPDFQTPFAPLFVGRQAPAAPAAPANRSLVPRPGVCPRRGCGTSLESRRLALKVAVDHRTYTRARVPGGLPGGLPGFQEDSRSTSILPLWRTITVIQPEDGQKPLLIVRCFRFAFYLIFSFFCSRRQKTGVVLAAMSGAPEAARGFDGI